MRRLIIGCGYLGKRVAQRWRAQGDLVTVLTRSEERAERLESDGYQTLVGDVTDAAAMASLPDTDTLLWAVGFDRQSGNRLEDVYVTGFSNMLAGLAEATQRLIYISSTGVYGQHDGDWVTEQTPCFPSRAGGRACLAAEQRLLASASAPVSVILRLAGIYGPDRLPRAGELVAEQPLSCNPDGVINLIHVDDAADIVCQVADKVLPLPRTYLVSDGHPVPRRAFYEELASRMCVNPPRFAPPEPGSDTRGSANGSKRISNRRMLSELVDALRYPTYREGLRSVVGSC